MALQDTDLLLVQRSSASYKMAATELSEYLGGGNSSVTVSATAPSAPQNGDMWWNSEDGNLYIYYTDVDSAQWVPSNSEAGGFVNATVGPNVPANASGGDLWYSTEDARLYIYDGAVWIDASPAAAPNISTISDTAPATPASGDLWYDLDSARLYVYNGQFWVDSAPGYGIQDGAVGGAQLADDINIVTTGDITATSYNTGQLAGFRNQIINGNMVFNQRAGDYGTSNALYTLDRWYKTASTGNVSRVTYANSGYALKVDPAAGRTLGNIQQAIELPGTGQSGPFLNGSTWTLSAMVRTEVVGETLYAGVGFVDNISGTNYAGAFGSNGTLPSQTTSTSWTKMSWTFTIDMDTPSTSEALFVGFKVDSLSGWIEYTDIQLELGPVATPFEHRPKGTELALCQRYTYVLNQPNVNAYFPITGFAKATNQGVFAVTFPVTMRVDNPGMSLTGSNTNLKVFHRAVATDATGFSQSDATATGTSFNVTCPVNELTAGDSLMLGTGPFAGGNGIIISAEL